MKDSQRRRRVQFNGKLSRFLIRLKTKMNDRRYAFMYQAPAEYETYEALHDLAKKLLGTGNVKDGINPGIKIIDFSEVPLRHPAGCGWTGRPPDLPDSVLEQPWRRR